MRAWYVAFILVALAAATASLAAPAPESADYRFAPGDVIEVTVTPQRSFDRTVTVQPDGKISYPLVGSLQVAGATVEQLTGQLRDRLSQELVDPQVIVSLREQSKPAAERISLLGAVRNPGSYEIKGGTTLVEVLAAAGGPTPLSDLRRVTITRADQSVRTMDLSQTEKTGRLERNALLQPGDFIVVPEGTPATVMLLGEISKPGLYEIRGETRLLDVIMQGGGPSAKADMRRVLVRRVGVAQPLTMDVQTLLRAEPAAPQAGGALTENPKGEPMAESSTAREANVQLQPGDTITVPETDQRVYIFGGVAKPGLYSFKTSDRLLDALAMADGATPDGDLSKVVLVRRDASGQPVTRQVDMKKAMAQGRMEENDLLSPGDVLYVSDKKKRSSASGVSGLIWSVVGLANLFRF